MKTFLSRLGSNRTSKILESIKILNSLPPLQSVSFSTVNHRRNFNVLFFSPRNEKHLRNFDTDNPQFIKEMKPESVSVTDTAHHPKSNYLAVKKLLNCDISPSMIIPHLALLGHTKEKVDKRIEDFHEIGIKSIMVIRGNPLVLGKNKDYKHHPEGYKEVTDIMDRIKQVSPKMEIIVTAYPIKHPFAKNMETDLDELQNKMDHGADRIVLQHCFDNNTVENFIENLRVRNINLPIMPSIMPITNPKYVTAFSTGAGIHIPAEIMQIFMKGSVKQNESEITDPEAYKDAVNYTVQQINDLKSLEIEEIDRINIYGSNNLKALKEILNAVTLDKIEQRDSYER